MLCIIISYKNDRITFITLHSDKLNLRMYLKDLNRGLPKSCSCSLFQMEFSILP